MKTVHNIELSTTLGKLIPKSNDADPSIQSNFLLIFASELANTFLKNPVDLSARDIRQQIPFGELVSLLDLPMPKNKQAITATEVQKTVTAHNQTTAEEQNVVEKDVAFR